MPYRDLYLEKLDKELSKSVRTLGIVVLVAIILITIMVGFHSRPAGAHMDELVSSPNPCGTHAVRAAWGAEARFKDAPAMMKYVSMEKVEVYFYKHSAPNDGIYVADSMSSMERKEYERSALYGWNEADFMIKHDKKAKYRHTYFVAYFLNECRKHE